MVYHLLLVLFGGRGWLVGVAWDVVCPKILSPEDGSYESKLFEIWNKHTFTHTIIYMAHECTHVHAHLSQSVILLSVFPDDPCLLELLLVHAAICFLALSISASILLTHNNKQ